MEISRSQRKLNVNEIIAKNQSKQNKINISQWSRRQKILIPVQISWRSTQGKSTSSSF